MTPKQREALRLIAERTDDVMPAPGELTSGETFADRYNVWVHWRTAQSLHRAGLVTYPFIGNGYDEPTTVAITDVGRAALDDA